MKIKEKSAKIKVLGFLFLFTFVFTLTANAQFNLQETTTIASGSSTSARIDLKDWKLAAIVFPSAFTGTSVTISTSADTTSANFKVVQYDGSDLSVTVALNKLCGIPPSKANQLLRYIKIISNGTEAAQRTLTIVRTKF